MKEIGGRIPPLSLAPPSPWHSGAGMTPETDTSGHTEAAPRRSRNPLRFCDADYFGLL